MPELKMQDAQLLLKKIYANPKNYDLKSIDGVVSGGDDQVSFRLYKTKEKVVFEVIVDELIFKNSTGDWTNSLIMLENAIRKIEGEAENSKIEQAKDKLRKYLAEE